MRLPILHTTLVQGREFLARRISTLFNLDGHYYVSGGFWTMVAQGVTVLGSLAVTVLFTNLLSEHDFGVYRYILGLGILISSLSLSGIDAAVFQAAAKKLYGFLSFAIRTSLQYNLIIFAVGVIGAAYYWLQGNGTLAVGCLIVALLQPVINSYQSTFSFLAGARHFKEATTAQFMRTVIVSTTSIVAVVITEDVLILVFVSLLSQFVANFIAYIFYRPTTNLALQTKDQTQYLHYAKHTSVRNLVANAAFRLDTVLIFQQLGAAELAIYTVASILPEQVKGVFKNLSLLILPKYVQHENLESIKASMPKRSLQLLLVFGAVTIVYIFIAPFVYRIFFPAYHDAILFSQLLALSFPAMIALLPLSALQAQLEERKLHYLNASQSFISILLTILFIYLLGLLGAILAKVLSRFVNLILTYYYVFSNQ